MPPPLQHPKQNHALCQKSEHFDGRVYPQQAQVRCPHFFSSLPDDLGPRGAAEVVHGLRETIRGNLPSTVDPSNNEHVVRQGEREMREGNADLSRGTASSRTGGAWTPSPSDFDRNADHLPGMSAPPSHRMQYAERKPESGVPGAGHMNTAQGGTHASSTQQQQPGIIPATADSTQHAHQNRHYGPPEDRPGDRGFVPGAQGGGF